MSELYKNNPNAANDQTKWDELTTFVSAKNDSPLVAISADFMHDKKELAQDLAEQTLNDEISGKGKLLKKIWKGNLFKRYYLKKYEHEFMDGERKTEVDGEEFDLDDFINMRSESAIKRFTLAAAEGAKEFFVHESADEKMEKASDAFTSSIDEAVRKYATAKVSNDKTLDDLMREFGNDIERAQAEAEDRGEKVDRKMINNFFEVAKQARQKVEHDVAIEKVMEGFAVYNADVRDGVRTKAHRDCIDKLVDKVENSKVGQFVPAEALGVAVSVVTALTQTGARAVGGAVGGAVFSSVSAGFREHKRVSEDRTRLIRDSANGLESNGDKNKYEAKLGDTIYDIRSAKSLTEDLQKAMDGGNKDEILDAIAQAKARIMFSDAESKDLIGYSSEDARGSERMALDMAVFEATKMAGRDLTKTIESMVKTVESALEKDVDEKDKKFKQLRAASAMKRAGKTAAFSALTFFATQEIGAAFSDSKIGILEKAGILKTTNKDDAEQTILANLVGENTRTVLGPVESITTDDPNVVDRLENQGYEKTLVGKGYAQVETKTEMVNVDLSESGGKVKVVYDGWANNGTKVSDGNELRAFIKDGTMVSSMHGGSTMNGQVFDYDAAAAAGKIKGYLTIGGEKIEVVSSINEAGQLTWGDNGVFTTTAGETIKAIGADGEKYYKYFEIAMDNGVDADGITHIMPFATDVGADTFSGGIQKVVESEIVTEYPAKYLLTKTNTAVEAIKTSYNGFAIPPLPYRQTINGVKRSSDEEDVGTKPIEKVIVEEGDEESGDNEEEVDMGTRPVERTVVLESAPAIPEEVSMLRKKLNEKLGLKEDVMIDADEEFANDSFEGGKSDYDFAFERYEKSVREKWVDLIGGEQYADMMFENGLPVTDEQSARFEDWWNKLPDESKKRIDYNPWLAFSKNTFVPWGNSLRSWIKAKKESEVA